MCGTFSAGHYRSSLASRPLFPTQRKQGDQQGCLVHLQPDLIRQLTADLARIAKDTTACVDAWSADNKEQLLSFEACDTWTTWKSRCAAVVQAVHRRKTDQQAPVDTAVRERNQYIETVQPWLRVRLAQLQREGERVAGSQARLRRLQERHKEVAARLEQVEAACAGAGVAAAVGEEAEAAGGGHPADSSSVPEVDVSSGALGEYLERWKAVQREHEAWIEAVEACEPFKHVGRVAADGVDLLAASRKVARQAERVAAKRRRAFALMPAALDEYRRVTARRRRYVQGLSDATRRQLDDLTRLSAQTLRCRHELGKLDEMQKALPGLDSEVEEHQQLHERIEDVRYELAKARFERSQSPKRRRLSAKAIADKDERLQTRLAQLRQSAAYRTACQRLRDLSALLPEVYARAPGVVPMHGTRASDLPTYLLSRDFHHITDLVAPTAMVCDNDDDDDDEQTPQQTRHLLLKAALKSEADEGTDGPPRFYVLKRFVGGKVRALRRTADIMAGLSDPHVLRLLGIVHDDDANAWFLMLPHYERGDLRQWLVDANITAATPDALRTKHIFRATVLLRGVLRGLVALHQAGVLHRDLKPDNVLVDRDGALAVICDFETSKHTGHSHVTNTLTMVGRTVGTLKYLAPEIVNGSSGATHSVQSDLYSFGVMMSELLSGGTACKTPQQVDQVPDRLLHPHAKAILRQLLCATAAERGNVTAASLLDTPFFRGAATERECMVCLDLFQPLDGLECHREYEPHFLCRACFAQHVAVECGAEVGDLAKREGRVFCPNRRLADSCTSRAYSDLEIATAVDAAGFAAYCKALGKVTEQRLAVEMNARVQQEVERLAKLDALQRQVERARHHIVDEILTLKCPRCRAAFVDFDGCMALTCGRCEAAFCGWCLQDCGRDAHRHVANCARVPRDVVDATFPPNALQVFHATHRRRQARLLADYLGGLQAPLRAAVIDAVRAVLNEAGHGNLVAG